MDCHIFEPPRRNFVGEKNIEIGKGESTCLRKPEDTPQNAQGIRSKVKECTFHAPIPKKSTKCPGSRARMMSLPSVGRDCPWIDLAGDYVVNAVDGSPKYNTPGSQSSSRHLARNTIACRFSACLAPFKLESPRLTNGTNRKVLDQINQNQ